MALTPAQIRAAELLSKGHSHQEVGDAVGVSRRTILRWLKLEDFKNLSYGLLSRASPVPQPVQQRHERTSEKRQQSLMAQDLVEDALLAVRDILVDVEGRTCDRLKAASLVGEWAGLSLKKPSMHEMEGLKALIEAGWVPDEVLDVLIDSSNDMRERVRNAFHNCFHNGNKKSLSQEDPERGIFDVNDGDFE